jgi:hypothetical protein
LPDLDFRSLCVVHIGGEVKQTVILAGPRRIEELANHHESTIVVLNHARQEQVVKSLSVELVNACICCGVNIPGIRGMEPV